MTGINELEYIFNFSISNLKTIFEKEAQDSFTIIRIDLLLDKPAKSAASAQWCQC